MKRFIIITFVLCFFNFGVAFADEAKDKAPTLEELHAIVGSQKTSKTFTDFIKAYGFYENHKRENSWGSWHGVFLELGVNGISVGIRPASDEARIAKPTIALPSKLEVGDSIAEIKKKLGKPIKTDYDPKDYYEMCFDGITVYTMGGKLFEVWLIPKQANGGQ